MYFGCIRFAQLLNRESGNRIWNSLRKGDSAGIVFIYLHPYVQVTTHANYALCILSHYPMFSYMRVLLSYILQVYISLPKIPHCPYYASSVLSSPVHFEGVYDFLSFLSVGKHIAL